MSKVLPFPAARGAGTAQWSHRQLPFNGAQQATAEAEDTWPEEDAGDGVSLEAWLA
jgi:hypothetical protein